MFRWSDSARAGVGSTLLAAILLQSTSCGTLLHPERRGQPHGRLDPAVVLLDGVGLLLFFVPGVIAFAVDFSTGAIYLPPGECRRADDPDTEELVRVSLPEGPVTAADIERIVAKETGQTVSLTSDNCRTRRLSTLRDFGHSLESLRRDAPPAD